MYSSDSRRFTKFNYFIGLSHPFIAQEVERVFLDNIVKMHGVPQSIVLDRDKVFIHSFWKELLKSLGTKLHMFTAYHSQMDG